MSQPMTVETLITNARLRGGLNDNASASAGERDVDLEIFFNDEMDELITWLRMAHEEYLVVEEKITPVGNTSLYRISPRATYQGIKNIYFRDTSANTRELLTHMDDQNLPWDEETADAPTYYLLQGNDIRFIPAPIAGMNLMSLP